MARFLVLDWDHQQLNIVLATVRKGVVGVIKAVALAEGQSPNPAEADALGRLLRDRLKEAGIPAAPVLACVGRDRVILKEVRHPAVAPSEEPAIIRFQVVKELTDPPDEVVIDYTPGETEPTGERRALALIVRRELLVAYQNLCRAAGLKLAGLCPRPFGSVACLKQVLGSSVLTPAPEPRDATVAVLTIGKPWTEFCVVRGDHLLFARSLTTGPGLPGEVRRNLALCDGQSPQHAVKAVYVASGTEFAAIRDHLQELAGVPVYSFDPFAGAERPGLPADNRGAFAGAVGLLHAQAQRGTLPINFVKPKQPKAERDPNQRRLALVGALAATVFLAVGVYCHGQLENRDQELTALFDEKTTVEQQLTKLTEDSKRVKALDEWTRGEIVWLDELYDLTDRFPDPDSLRLIQLTGDPLAQTTKSRYVARMVLKGIMTNDYQPVNKLETRLVGDGHYRVEPKVVGRNMATDRFRFPQQFTTRIEIEKLPPEKFVRRLPDQAAPAESDRGRSGDAAQDFGFGGFEGGRP